MAKLEKTMFRAYDIRGRVNENELNAKSMAFIAKGFAKMLSEKGVDKCIVGMDARPYNNELKEALVSGLASSGINVIDIGLVTTPMAYFAQWHLDVKGVAAITASHNPNGWSGLKIGCGKSSTFLPGEIEKLYKIIEQEDFVSGNGKIEEDNIDEAYVKEIAGKIKLGHGLKLVANCRNGVAGKIAPKVLRAIGCEVVELFCEIDDSYPNGVANPSLDEMVHELGEKVVEEKADLGLAFDADGDRIGSVDEKGKLIYADRMLALLARNLLKEHPKSKIVFDMKSSQLLEDDIEAHNGIPVRTMVGHSFIKQKVHETKAGLGGERSGHIFFVKDWYGFDDACFAAAKFVEYVSNQGKPLSKITETLPKYFSSPVIHAPCPDETKYEVIKKVVAYMKKKYPNVNDLDGARVVFQDGSFLVRPSSNLPVMVLGFEANSEKRMKELEQLLRQELKNFPEISQEWRNG